MSLDTCMVKMHKINTSLVLQATPGTSELVVCYMCGELTLQWWRTKGGRSSPTSLSPCAMQWICHVPPLNHMYGFLKFDYNYRQSLNTGGHKGMFFSLYMDGSFTLKKLYMDGSFTLKKPLFFAQTHYTYTGFKGGF